MSTTITLRELTKQFSGFVRSGPTTAVDRVSLTIQQGELFFLLGPSGCGKTTLLRMIAGFIEPTSGQILFQPAAAPNQPLAPARDVTFLPPNKRNTGMVFQSYALWPHMTVAKNVAFGLEVRKVPAEERARRVQEALEVVRMGQYADRKPTQLSGGQQQRVALARALVIKPDVLLLDEPLSNLDAKLRLELRSEIRRICKQAGITTIYVTHDQKEALSMADRIAIVSQGKVVQLGPPGELYRSPNSRFVAEFLGETNFLPCQVLEPLTAGKDRVSARVSVQTPVGRLQAGSVSSELATGAQGAVCSIRPEAFRLNDPDGINTLFGSVADSTYLGEVAQLIIDLDGGERVHVSTLNPASTSRAGERVRVSVAPEDVVVLPA